MAQPSTRDLGAVSHLDALLATVGPVAGLNIIDIGCGEGRLTRALAALGARVTGCDPFIAGTAWTEHGAGSYRLVKAAADAIPAPDHQADLVLFVFSLHHVPGEKLAGRARRGAPGVAAVGPALCGGTAGARPASLCRCAVP